VFQALGLLVQLLQSQLRVLVELLIVHQLANRALALIHLLKDFLQIGHGLSRLPIELFIRYQLADRAVARVNFIDDFARVGDRGPYFSSRVLQVADRGEGGVVERLILDELAQRAVALFDLGGDVGGEVLEVGDGQRQRVFVGGYEIHERPDQRINLKAGEALGEVFHAGSDVIDLLHHGAQISLLGGANILIILQRLASRGAEIDGNKVLAEQPRELDRRDTVGLHLRGGAHFHHDPDAIVGELDPLDAADFDAGHFHTVAHFEVLNVVEEGVYMLAAFECLEAADSFQNNRRGQHDQRDEKSN